MRFQNIRVTDAGVELDRLDKQADGSILKLSLSNPSKPLPSFSAAMQAFTGYAVDLIDAPEWHDDVKVTSLHLSEEAKTNRRGLIVTFTRKVERAKNRVVVVNTPLMHAPVEDQEGTNPGTFPKEVFQMIYEVEAQATKYWNGKREQTEIFADTSTASEVDEAPETTTAAPAARGRGRKKNRDFIPGVGPIVNADKTEEPTDENLRQVLLSADRDVPIDAIARWSSQERDAAQRWAMALIESVLNKKPLKVDEPEVVKRDATLPLSAEEWDQPNPLAGTPKADIQPVAGAK